MKLKTLYLNMIKYGSKTIELRLFDEKRKLIKNGDKIVFSDVGISQNTVTTQVINLHIAQDFAMLCDKINSKDAGFISSKDLIATLEDFYPTKKQQKYGVVGIEIKLI